MTNLELKQIRAALKMTQVTLAEELGVAVATVARWEARSGRWPIPAPIVRLLNFLLTARRERE